MAEKRMFSKSITESDAFLELPHSARNLYFHLGMNGDDDGFVNNSKKIQRTTGCNDRDIALLVEKNFILTFPSGIIAIKHWRMNNNIRGDRYTPTAYQEEYKSLVVKENGIYSMAPPGIPNDNQPATEGIPNDTQPATKQGAQIRLDEIRLDEIRGAAPPPGGGDSTQPKPSITEMFSNLVKKKSYGEKVK